MKKIISVLFLILSLHATAENGHQLWLRSKSARPVQVVCPSSSATLNLAKEELRSGWQGEANASVKLTIGS
ncbi:MAG: hypothetical protein PHV66_07360, partial [Bacteroidales bacterium]|nr:hypothetical protein [Bacteroidales bacterium]